MRYFYLLFVLNLSLLTACPSTNNKKCDKALLLLESQATNDKIPEETEDMCEITLCKQVFSETWSTTTLLDEDCDGKKDRCLVTILDEQGREVSGATDKNCDGYSNFCWAKKYNVDNQEILHIGDERCDGIQDECVTREYNADGQEISRSKDINCNNNPDYCTSYEYTDGRKSKEFFDKGCNGVITSCEHYEYNESGQRIRAIVYDGCTETQTLCVDFIYDTSDNLIRENRDVDCNGTTDGKTFYSYKENNIKTLIVNLDTTYPFDFCTFINYPVTSDANSTPEL